jgi:hypothetical protein
MKWIIDTGRLSRVITENEIPEGFLETPVRSQIQIVHYERCSACSYAPIILAGLSLIVRHMSSRETTLDVTGKHKITEQSALPTVVKHFDWAQRVVKASESLGV